MWRRMFWWWTRDRQEQDLEKELRAHIAIDVEQRLQQGESPEEAERAARRAFGNQAQIAEEAREVWRFIWLEQLWRDIHYGLRSLRRTPAVTLAVIATFALGIGANTALFSVIYTVLLKPLPYKDPERLVWINAGTTLSGVRGGGPERRFSSMVVTADLLEWRQANIFDAIASFRIREETVGVNDEAWRPRVARSSEPLGTVLGVTPVLGRDFLAAELERGAAGVALLSNQMFRQRFRGNSSVIGTSIRIGNQPYTVIGVMPPGFRLPLPADEQTQFEAEMIANDPINPAAPFLDSAVARLRSGQSIDAARSEMLAIMKSNDEQGRTPSEVRGRQLRLEPLHERIVGALRFRLLVLWASVGFVLLIACVNVTNLLLARSAARARELAIRTAVGAARLRLIRQQLTESVVLALVGGMTGAAFAALAVQALVGRTPLEIPRLRDAAVDANALAFTFAICAITGIVSGLVSALTASNIQPVDVLTKAARGGSAWKRRLHGVLVVSELAMAMVLTVGAALMVKSIWRIDAGMAGSEQVFSARVELAGGFLLPQGPRGPARTAGWLAQLAARAAYIAETVEQIEALPGVTAAAVCTCGPNSKANPSLGLRGIARIDGSNPEATDFAVVTPHYFTAVGMRLVAGRSFDRAEKKGGLRPAVVNQAFLRPYGVSPASAVGMYIGGADQTGEPEDPARTFRIVGVVSDFYTRPDQPAPAQWFGSMDSEPLMFESGDVSVRTSGDPIAVAGQVRRILTRDRATLMIGGETLADQMSASIAPRRFQGLLLISFAAMALLLAVVGTYGVLNYTVAERTQEIGVRIALGASRQDIMRMVLWRAVQLGAVGIVLGVGGALALTTVTANLFYGVRPTDPWIYVVVCTIMLAVALAAAALPAWRAMRVDPIDALRTE